MLAIATLTELWLQVHDLGGTVGLDLVSWRRLPESLDYRDSHTGARRELPVEVELIVTHRGPEGRALFIARVKRVPVARLVAVLGRFTNYLTALTASGSK